MMANAKRIEIRFPRLGVVRAAGHHEMAGGKRDDYDTPWAVNCRPLGVLDRRRRGGSRAGIAVGGTALPTPPLTVSGNTAVVYNSATGTSSVVTASAGALPATFTLGTIYRGRLLLASDHAISASRMGDFTDWDYGASLDDSARPTKLQLAEAFGGGEDVTALVGYKDRDLLAATEAELWHLAGDPVTGELHNVSRSTGIIGSQAWTLVGGTVFFMAKDGLWSVGVDGSDLKPVSPGVIPDDLVDLSGANTMLAYSPTEQGIYLFTDGETYQWFYDLVDGGFWPMTMASVPNQSALVDGELRLARTGTTMEIGGEETITSDVLLGPLRLNTSGGFGQIQALNGTMALESGSVTWSIILGDTAESSAERARAAVGGTTGYVAATGTFTAGRSHMAYPRSRSPWAVLWLSSTAQWAYESLVLDLIPSGEWR